VKDEISPAWRKLIHLPPWAQAMLSGGGGGGGGARELERRGGDRGQIGGQGVGARESWRVRVCVMICASIRATSAAGKCRLDY